MNEEVPLAGGNVNPLVVRNNETVRRAQHPCSSTTHSLLLHLLAQGFAGCPRFLGVDNQEREMLSYLPGEVGFMPYLWQGEDALVAAARLLRVYHDATVDFVPPPQACWQFVYPDAARHEVICHNDFAPYNLVCSDGTPYAVIDFDMAGPGPRLRDVAYAAYWFVPLTFHSDLRELALADVRSGSRRLHLFCAAYGIEATLELLDMVEEVLRFLGDWLETRAKMGDTGCQKMITEGHLTHWRAEWQAFQQHRSLIEPTLPCTRS